MKLKELIRNIRDAKISGNADVDITGIAYDSRKVARGSLFVAIKGEHADGASYINDAVKNGASAILASHDSGCDVPQVITADPSLALAGVSSIFFGEPSRKMRLIGITGTNGKTTVSYIIESILNADKKDVGVIGTVSWKFKGKVLPAPNTTPMSYDLQGLLSQMLSSGVTDVAMEVSSHSLDQQRVAFVEFDAAVFTNLTRDHLDYHKDIDGYFAAKELFFTRYLKESCKKNKVAAVNWDDAYGRKIGLGNVIKYGFCNAADVKVNNLENTMDGIACDIETPWGRFDCKSHLKGKFNVSNILAAVAVAGGLGISIETIRNGIGSIRNVPGRLEEIRSLMGFSVFVDYAHTPDALENVLRTLKDISGGRIITVFGCGGNRDHGKRPMMGSVAARYSDRIIVTSDNPRDENPMFIIGEIVEGIKGEGFKAFEVEEDRAKAIAAAINDARKGDIVLVAGKGHENYQIVGKDVRHFDDIEVVKKELK